MSKKDISPYYQSGDTDVEHRDIGAAGDEHPFGDEPKEWEADLRPLIRQVADELYESWEQTIREYLANAETACLKVQRFIENPEASPFDDMIVSDGYSPAIEVVWNKQEQKVIIQDNGIGMAGIEVDEVFRHIGRSAARDIGTMSGAFGMGALSFIKFIGPENMMVMLSHSRLNNDNASYLVTLAGIEPVRGSLPEEQYGTKFKLDQRHDDMNVRRAVEKYAKWMRVPVMYREIDENGEEVFNEDWGDTRLFDDYRKDRYVDWQVVEGAYEAFCSPEADSKTLLLSMDIERNSRSQGNPPYEYDIRILDESGKVVHSTNGNEGLIPVERIEYEKMLIDARDEFITENLLSNKDVTAYKALGNEYDYAIEEQTLEECDKLPIAEYVPLDEGDDQLVGEKVVLAGPHSGRKVISEEEWNELDEGRASQFIPKDEIEPFDVSSEEGDLCLPKPTTDRSKLQENDEFWKYISKKFEEEYDEEIMRWLGKLRQSDDESKTIREMSPKTVEDIKNEVVR